MHGVDGAIRFAEADGPVSLPFAFECVISESWYGRAAPSPSNRTRSTQRANLRTMCSGILVSCFFAVFDSSTFTVSVYPGFGYSQVSPGSDIPVRARPIRPWVGAKESFQRSWSPKVRVTELRLSIQGSNQRGLPFGPFQRTPARYGNRSSRQTRQRPHGAQPAPRRSLGLPGLMVARHGSSSNSRWSDKACRTARIFTLPQLDVVARAARARRQRLRPSPEHAFPSLSHRHTPIVHRSGEPRASSHRRRCPNRRSDHNAFVLEGNRGEQRPFQLSTYP
jgi:hypothetical protein